MFNFLKELFSGDPGMSKETFPSSEQTIAIAQTADIDLALKEYFLLADTVEKDGKILWCVSSATKGSQQLVFIDDETGEIVETKRAGVRWRLTARWITGSPWKEYCG